MNRQLSSLAILAVFFIAIASLSEASRAKQNYNSVDRVNDQIRTELNAAQTYLSLSSYFAHDTVALNGFSKMFEHSWKEEIEHAQKFISYQIKRGGKVVTPVVEAPKNDSKWHEMSACQILDIVLGLEMQVHQHLLDLHKYADEQNDPHLQDFIESEYLTEQVDANKEIADLLRRLETATTVYTSENSKYISCNGLGLHLVDKELEGKY